MRTTTVSPERNAAAPADPRDEALLERLRLRGIPRLDGEEDVAAFLQGEGEGEALLFFPERVAQVPESWDVAVILPEVLKSQRGLRLAVLPPAVGRALQPRYGFRRWPAVVLLRGGQYVGALEGMQDWVPFQQTLADLRGKPAGRAPIALHAADTNASCH